MKKKLIIICLFSLFLLVACDKSEPINRSCEVIEKGNIYGVRFTGTYARIDNQSCCVIPGWDEEYFKENRNYTMTNSFTYCISDRNRGDITIHT